MSLLKVVLDTNAVLRSISRRSEYAIVIDKLYDGAFELLPNLKKTDVHYQLQLITHDVDDNKFSDCAFASNAHYLVTNDRHFNVLKSIDFPAINTITLEDFARRI